MRVGIVGTGLIGTKRGLALKSLGKDTVIAVNDVDKSRAEKLASNFNRCGIFENWHSLVSDPNLEAVVVSTTHDSLAEISLAALKNGKHVLCEKPLGINVSEIEKCVRQAKKSHLVYKAGFNHRFHPAIEKAHKLFDEGIVGKLIFIKATYGIGGRPGYEKEWRMNKLISGGGELIDQGTHLIDLSRWFMGAVKEVKSELFTFFWPVKVEDNVFLWLKGRNMIAELHASWTEWKNRFSFEIYGTKGYLKIFGLGGSYGVETLTYGLRVPGKAPIEKQWEFPGEDLSWKKEWVNFRNAISGKQELVGSGKDGLAMMRIISQIYSKGNV